MDNNLYKVIKSKNKFTDFGEYSRLYLFTTENIKGYLKYFDLNGKNVLAPTSSGDHAFESILKGAKSVDMFDINKYSKYMVKLKIAAIKALERGEFLEYFLVKYNNHNNDYVFNKKTYKKIRKYLDNETKNFFDEAYEITKTGVNLRNSSLFYNNRNDEYRQSKICLYLQPENYNYLKKNIYKLDKSKYYECNLFNLPSKLNKYYDLMMLSNISNYFNDIDEFRKFTDLRLMQNLSKNGVLIREYYYSNTEGCKNYYGTKYEFDAFNDYGKDYVITKKRN